MTDWRSGNGFLGRVEDELGLALSVKGPMRYGDKRQYVLVAEYECFGLDTVTQVPVGDRLPVEDGAWATHVSSLLHRIEEAVAERFEIAFDHVYKEIQEGED